MSSLTLMDCWDCISYESKIKEIETRRQTGTCNGGRGSPCTSPALEISYITSPAATFFFSSPLSAFAFLSIVSPPLAMSLIAMNLNVSDKSLGLPL